MHSAKERVKTTFVGDGDHLLFTDFLNNTKKCAKNKIKNKHYYEYLKMREDLFVNFVVFQMKCYIKKFKISKEEIVEAKVILICFKQKI